MATTDITSGLTGAQRNAYSAIQNILQQYGLQSLAGDLLQYVQQGFSSDTIALELQNTAAWKTRFAGNIARQKAGMPVLSPSEYIATENAYRAVMRQAGVPAGFYDQTSDFASFIGKDVSPTELQDRVKAATGFIQSADPAQLAYMRQHYTTGDLIAYALDPDRANPLVQKQFGAATVGGIANDNRVNGLSQYEAERLATNGVDASSARQGFGAIGMEQGTLNNLAAYGGEQRLSADQLSEGAFMSDAQTNLQIQQLTQQEKERFNGSTGTGSPTLVRYTGGL